jgi:hypothetical protein
VRNLLFKTVPGTFPIRAAAVTVGEDVDIELTVVLHPAGPGSVQ